ncbi:MAG: DUF502 domain-containing protein [Saprospiraceae bacterium]|nr:DUF502 domain-containing protein [Saprospiraceae bacterium]
MKRLQKFVVTTMIGGGLILLPIVILVFVVKIIIQFIDNAISPLTQLVEWEIPGLLIDVIALIAIILLCFLIGLFVRTRMGMSVFKYIEREWLEIIPAYSTIRDIVQQFSGTKKAPFKKVVMVDPFKSGVKMTGFITDEHEDYCTIFVPTAPNPTNGFIFHVHKDHLEWLDIRTEAAMRTVVGMGVGSQDMIHQNVVEEEPEDREPVEIERTTDR